MTKNAAVSKTGQICARGYIVSRNNACRLFKTFCFSLELMALKHMYDHLKVRTICGGGNCKVHGGNKNFIQILG